MDSYGKGGDQIIKPSLVCKACPPRRATSQELTNGDLAGGHFLGLRMMVISKTISMTGS